MKEIKFNLTLEETNLIFKALGERPFNEVFELIGKLNEQANSQLSNKADLLKYNKEIDDILNDSE